jgi:hypothetical protein
VGESEQFHTVVSNVPMVPAPDDDMNREQWWYEDRENLSTPRKACPNTAVSIRLPMQTALGLNPQLGGDQLPDL